MEKWACITVAVRQTRFTASLLAYLKANPPHVEPFTNRTPPIYMCRERSEKLEF